VHTINFPSKIIAMISRLAFCISLICSLPVALHAQSTEDAIKARLKDKPLYLHGFWGDDYLTFDPTGHLGFKSYLVPFTLAGFDLRKVQLKQDRLILEGARMGLEFSGANPLRVQLKTPNRYYESIHIEIAAPFDGDYGPALDQIFIDGLENLAPLVPFYWRKYASEHFATSPKPAASTPVSKSSSDPKDRPDFPVLLTSAVPTYTDSARMMSYNGKTLVRVTIRPDGSVNNPVIVLPLGLGLDESAIIAALHYTFKPAMQHGKPVAFEINLEVSFTHY
jgi:TonB family protein